MATPNLRMFRCMCILRPWSAFRVMFEQPRQETEQEKMCKLFTGTGEAAVPSLYHDVND